MANLPTPGNTTTHGSEIDAWKSGSTNTGSSGFGDLKADPNASKIWNVEGVSTGTKVAGHLTIMLQILNAFIIGHPQTPLNEVANFIPLASQLADSIIGHYGQFKPVK